MNYFVFLQEWNNCDILETPYSYYFDTSNGMGKPKLSMLSVWHLS